MNSLMERKSDRLTPHDSHGSTSILRRLSSGRPYEHSAPVVVREALESTGQPLANNARAFMESQFNRDFSRVRVHTDARAAEASRAIGAQAFTVGQNIVFADGEYMPGTDHGNALLAHELTHTLQQNTIAVTEGAPLNVSDPSGLEELEAAASVSALERGEVLNSVGRRDAQISRQPSAAPSEDPGAKRARLAKEMILKLKAAGTTYLQEIQGRDWNNTAIADCSKFVQWVLEASSEGELFGRGRGTTSSMASVIEKLTVDEKPPYRLTDPKPGDIMMWGAHVAIAYEVKEEKGVKYLTYANMGNSGPNLLKVKADDIAQIDRWGAGAFLGFWTPP